MKILQSVHSSTRRNFKEHEFDHPKIKSAFFTHADLNRALLFRLYRGQKKDLA